MPDDQYLSPADIDALTAIAEDSGLALKELLALDRDQMQKIRDRITAQRQRAVDDIEACEDEMARRVIAEAEQIIGGPEFRFVFKLSTHNLCPLCGEDTDAPLMFGIAVAGKDGRVCEECADKVGIHGTWLVCNGLEEIHMALYQNPNADTRSEIMTVAIEGLGVLGDAYGLAVDQDEDD